MIAGTGTASTRPTRPEAGWADRWDLALLAALPALAVLLVCATTPSDVLPHTNPDMLLYYRVAGQVTSGQAPYLDFPFEYPPLAIVPMVVPYIAWPGGHPAMLDYEWFWAFQNAALASVVALSVAWLAIRGSTGSVAARALATWALVAMLQAPLLAWRFDITAVALAVGAVVLVVAGRSGPAGALLALGTLVKIFPVALLPVLLAWLLARDDRAGALRLVAGFAAAGVIVAIAVVAIVGPEPALSFVSYQDERLVQIESMASSVALGLHVLAGLPVTIGYGFQSLQVSAPGLDVVLALESLLLVAGIAVVSVLAALRFRSERQMLGSPSLATLYAYLMAVIIALLAANKVFSAQYLLWMLPFGCLLPRRQTAVVVLAAALSILVFPLSYDDLIDLEPSAITMLAARNALLLGLLGWVLVRYRPVRERGPETYGAMAAVSERTS